MRAASSLSLSCSLRSVHWFILATAAVWCWVSRREIARVTRTSADDDLEDSDLVSIN